jgi:hypothetical protein
MLYGGFAVYLTWPLVTNLDSTIYVSPARYRGDYQSIIAYLRETVDGWHNPFVPGRIDTFAAPYGFPSLWVINIASFSSTIVLYALAKVFSQLGPSTP